MFASNFNIILINGDGGRSTYVQTQDRFFVWVRTLDNSDLARNLQKLIKDLLMSTQKPD